MSLVFCGVFSSLRIGSVSAYKCIAAVKATAKAMKIVSDAFDNDSACMSGLLTPKGNARINMLP